MWYVSSLYLQQVLGLSPISTGLTFLPMALTIFVTARVAGRLVGRFGVRSTLGGGLVLMASGLLLVRADRRERQRRRIRGPPRRPGRDRDRALGRRLDDRRHPGGATRAGRSRVGPRQHLAPGRWGDRDRAAHLAGQPAHQSSDRPEPGRAERTDRRLSARLPDRRRAVRTGGALRGDAAAEAGGDAASRCALTRGSRRAGGRRLLRGGRLRIRGRPGCADRRVHHAWRLHVRLGAEPAPARDPRRSDGRQRTARTRLHHGRELLRPDLPADRRSERPTDARQPVCSRSGSGRCPPTSSRRT